MHARSSRKARLGVAAPIAAAALFATACTSSHTAAPDGSSSSSASSASSASSLTVKAQSGPLGNFLTDSSGRALYLFASDTNLTSTCSGACASDWPPLTADGSVRASDGAARSDVAAITRPDGTKQVAYAGHPLYYFAGDHGVGQTNGQGVDEFGAHWWLVAPSGQKITTGAASAPSSSAGYNTGGRGY